MQTAGHAEPGLDELAFVAVDRAAGRGVAAFGRRFVQRMQQRGDFGRARDRVARASTEGTWQNRAGMVGVGACDESAMSKRLAMSGLAGLRFTGRRIGSSAAVAAGHALPWVQRESFSHRKEIFTVNLGHFMPVGQSFARVLWAICLAITTIERCNPPGRQPVMRRAAASKSVPSR